MFLRHLTDSALVAAVMRLSESNLMDDFNTMGLFFEALCERDLQFYASAMGGKLLHYRDGRGREIDAVVELPDGMWGAFEIKMTAEHIDESADNLLKLNEIFENDLDCRPPEFFCVLCGTESIAYRREGGVYVVPICSLGP